MRFAAFIILLFAETFAFAIDVEPLLQNTTIDYSAVANLTGTSKDIVIVTGIHDYNRIGWSHDLLILDNKGFNQMLLLSTYLRFSDSPFSFQVSKSTETPILGVQ